MKGIVFDFNGTLLWDSGLHERAWGIMAEKYIGRTLSHAEMMENMHGRTNDKILLWMLNRQPDKDESSRLAAEKESIYRDMCLKLGDRFVLAPGASDLLNQLTRQKVPRAIATSSAIDNLEFYIDTFNLYQWFDESCIIYDQGLFPGKPAPDIYLHAFNAIGLKPSECVVAEDSLPGIESAISAGAAQVIVINESADFGYVNGIKGNIRTIRNFNEMIDTN